MWLGFPSLTDPIIGIHRNRETFSLDVTEDTHTRKNCWGLIFCGVNSMLFAYYRLGSKYPTASSTLDALGQLITEHGIPRNINMDSYGILGAEKKWKQVLGRTFIPLFLSEPDRHNKNPVKNSIQSYKAGCSKIRNYCKAGVLAYHCDMMEYL